MEFRLNNDSPKTRDFCNSHERLSLGSDSAPYTALRRGTALEEKPGRARGTPTPRVQSPSPQGHDGDSPVVPVVTIITANHGAPVIGLVAAGTDPDLVPPFVSDLGLQGREQNRDALRRKYPKKGTIRIITSHCEANTQTD